MDKETVSGILKNALESVGVPVARLFYDGSATTFIVFQIAYGQEVNYSDDDTEEAEYIFQVHIYSKEDYTDLLKQVKNAVKAAGFYNVIINPEIFEKDTGLYHVPLEINYWEE